MSTKVTSFYWERQELSGTKKLCLLALADFADNHGIAYPGIGRLAERCSCSPRNVQKILRQLEDEGEIYTDHNEGARTAHGPTNRYYLTRYRQSMRLGAAPTGEPADTPDGVNWGSPGERGDTPGVNVVTPLGVNVVTPDPIADPSVEPMPAAACAREAPKIPERSDLTPAQELLPIRNLFEQMFRLPCQRDMEHIKALWAMTKDLAVIKPAFVEIQDRMKRGRHIAWPAAVAQHVAGDILEGRFYATTRQAKPASHRRAGTRQKAPRRPEPKGRIGFDPELAERIERINRGDFTPEELAFRAQEKAHFGLS